MTAWGANWLDSSNHSILAKQAGWSNWMKWLKSYVNWVGYNKLVKFQAGLGDEFSASNAFEVGKLAMNYDGEWRVAFIQAEHPTLNYGTAPMPAANPKLYGSGYINGTIIGIPKNGKHEAEAWDLVEVPDDEHARARRAVERPAQRAVDVGFAHVEGADTGRALRDVPEDLREQVLVDLADHGGRRLVHERGAELRDEVAGGEGVEPRLQPRRSSTASSMRWSSRPAAAECRDLK